MNRNILIGIMLVVLVLSVFVAQSQYQSNPNTVRIAYLPVVQALPLYVAIEKGYFGDEGIEVEAVKIDSPNLIIDALISGQVDMGSPSTASGITAISQHRNPGTLKIFAANGGTPPDNVDNLLLVRSDSDIQDIRDLEGKSVGILPGIQFRTIAKHILASEGIDPEKVELIDLAIPLQLQALESGQVDALLTLEPVGTIGRGQGTTRDLVDGPMVRYIADPWYGGVGVVTASFMAEDPELASKAIAVFDRAIQDIKEDPDDARQFLKGYTALTDELIQEVPLPVWKMHDEFEQPDIDALQDFFDIFFHFGVIEERVTVQELLYSP